MTFSTLEPYNIQTKKNEAILSILRSSPASIRSRYKTPIPTNVDFSSIVQANNSKIISNGNEITEETNKIEDPNEITEATTITQSLKVMHFVNIADFMPSNFQEQVCTITVKNFPMVLDLVIENLLVYFFSNFKFSWSFIDDSHVEGRLIFIRFGSMDHVRWLANELVMLRFKTAFAGSTIHFEPFASEYLKDLPDEQFTGSLASIKALLTSKKLDSDDAGPANYDAYRVDESELIEVPKDLKETIKKDIIRFRTKVLKDEKENRRKEAESERIRTKNKLQSLFLDAAKQDLEMDEAPFVESTEHEEMTDSQYEAFLKSQREKEYNDKYLAKVNALTELEQNQRTFLTSSLERARNYEQQVLDNKLESLKVWKQFDDNKHDPDLPAKYHLHHNNYPEYLRLRAIEKEREENRDAADEEAERQEEDARKNANQFMTSLSESIPAEVAPKSKSTSSDVVIANLDATVFRSKIGELVEEFLGVKEEFVIDFIFKHLVAHNFDKNDDLLADLTEILDDDAIIVIERLQQYAGLT